MIKDMRTAISIFGKDRPGIIASLTKILVEHGANIEDASSTLLQDHFAMILVIAVENVDGDELKRIIESDPNLSDMSVSLSKELRDDDQSGEEHTVAKYIFHLAVSDTPGIVARVTEVLSRHDSNIVDCATRKNNSTGVFSMILDVDVPFKDEETIVEELSHVVEEYSGDVVFQRVDDVDL